MGIVEKRLIEPLNVEFEGQALRVGYVRSVGTASSLRQDMIFGKHTRNKKKRPRIDSEANFHPCPVSPPRTDRLALCTRYVTQALKHEPRS
jgi:hypothetical protein